VAGILTANLLTNLAVGTFLLGWMVRQTGFVPSARAARDLRRFGVPYQLATVGTFVLTFGDRIFLQAFHGLYVVGLHGLAYQFGFVLVNLTSAPFFRAWEPERQNLATSATREVRDVRYNQAFRYLNLLVLSGAVGIALFAWPLLAVMSAPAFRPAARFVPVILVAFVLQIWTDVVSLGIDVSERTRYATYATWIGVVVILASYATLIPPFGAMGAAVATILGYGVRFLCLQRWSHRLWPVSWGWGQPLRLATVGVSVVLVHLGLPYGSWFGRLVNACGAFLVYAAAAWIFVLSPAERRQITRFLRAPQRILSGVPTA
jgi:O-antigen/teichoic acid export membrane protein